VHPEKILRIGPAEYVVSTAALLEGFFTTSELDVTELTCNKST